MTDENDSITGTEMEQVKIILNALYLCIGYAIEYIAAQEGTKSAERFKAGMLVSLKKGDIDMALLEESKTFDLVISKIEALTVPIVSGVDKS